MEQDWSSEIEELMKKYLTLYVASIDWGPHIDTLWERLYKKSKNVEAASKLLRQIVSCTIMLPSVERSTYIDPSNPYLLLLKMPYYNQLEQQDWVKLLNDTIDRDAEIENYRTKMLSLGIIDLIDLDPVSRQAFNWLYLAGEEASDITNANKADVKQRFGNLVKTYGGAAICNVFSRHQKALKDVLNWRTGYFFERVLHDIYSPEQLLKIKRADLERANPKLIKKLTGV